MVLDSEPSSPSDAGPPPASLAIDLLGAGDEPPKTLAAAAYDALVYFTPAWAKFVAFAAPQLVLLPFTQGMMFSLGLYLGRTVLVRPLMAKLRIRQYS